MPSDAQLRRAYGTNYYGSGSSKFIAPVERLRDVAARARASALAHGLAPGSSLLDIGCGDGRFLSSFQGQGKFQLHGIEMPGPAATRAAQNPAIQLHTGDLATAPYQDGTFDFVSMVHVIEHLPKPLATLRKVSALLKPGGTLFIAYPNVSSWQARWAKASWFHLDPPRHLSLVPPKTLTSILNKHGLSELRSSHLNLEQNLYGWTQSLLNMLHGQKNLFYNTLKHRDWSKQPFTFALDAAITVAALPLAIATDIAAAFAKKGATVELLYRKN